MVSGVWVYERLVWNCERRVATSCAVKPEVKRRSKPCGAGAVVELPRRWDALLLLIALVLCRRAV
jgi:hypothetical protein